MRSLRPARAARKPGWPTAAVAIALVAGLLLGTARSYSGGKDISSRSADLSSLVEGAQARVAAAETTAAALQSAIDEQASHDMSPQLATARGSTAALAPAAGLTSVSGPGVQATLADAPRDRQGNYPAGVNPDDLVVHQQDVQAVVNALWAGGAEAMTIMDQRVIATSAVRCIGNTLLLQGRAYSPPFVVTAIGNGAKMLAAINAEPGVALLDEYVQQYGLGFTVQQLANVTMPGYRGLVHLTAAQQEK